MIGRDYTDTRLAIVFISSFAGITTDFGDDVVGGVVFRFNVGGGIGGELDEVLLEVLFFFGQFRGDLLLLRFRWVLHHVEV